MADINELIRMYPEKESQLLRMYAKNHLLIKDESGIIINDECLKILGEDKVNLISCFPEIATQVVKLDAKTLKLIERLVGQYQKSTASSEWTTLFNDVLSNISKYNTLIESIEVEQINLLDGQTINNLINIMIEPNSLDISRLDQVEEYRRIRSEKCKEIFENTTDYDVKLDMFLTSKFGISKKYAEELLERYAEDINSIKDDKLKSFIRNLSSICNMPENEENLKKLTLTMSKDIVIPMSINEDFNRIALDKKLKQSFMELYIDEGLLKISDALPIESDITNPGSKENVYELPFDENGIKNFNIFIHDIDVCLDSARATEDYYKNWNRCEMNSPHICASYIRRDCLRTAGNGVSFGFNSVTNDDLVSASPTDSYSNGIGFTSSATDKYYNPDNQIRNTGMIDDKQYNEIDIRRFIENNGTVEARQPDYIIIFKSGENVTNLEKAQKVAEDFEKHTGKKLPILIVDKDKCRETELLQIAKMQLEYDAEPSEELKKKIDSKKEMLIRDNNSVNYIDDSITAYQISVLQLEFENNPFNIELRDKIESIKQNYTKKLITEGRLSSGITIEDSTGLGTTEELEEWSEETIDSNGNEWDDEELGDWDNSDSWEDETLDETEITESFNQLISKKYSTLKEFAERGKSHKVAEAFLTDEKAKKIARSKGVPLKKGMVQEDFASLENLQEINKEAKSFDED